MAFLRQQDSRFDPKVAMENDGQLNNNNEQALGVTLGDNTAWDDYSVEYDMDALLGEDQNVDTDQRTDDDDHLPESETPPRSKRPKRFKVQQVQELEATFHECTHPDIEQRQQIGARIGLEERQVRFWFQNRRSSAKSKACGNEVKELLQENEQLKAHNNELKQLMLDPTCLKCRHPAAAIRATSERQLLLSENARLKHELMRANAYMKRSIRQPERPQSMQATLRLHAERALKEFLMLATKGQPLWMPTVDGEVLSEQHYDLQTFPAGLLGLCPWGFVMEATRETDVIKGDAEDLVGILTDVAQWSEMFPDIVSYVRSSNVICSGTSSLRDGLIQLMDVEFWVQTPCLTNRNVKFLRFSKMISERKWVVVDVSVDGFLQQSSGTSCTGYRLLPSGCILEGMSGGFCKVTWVVHGEYLEAAVPTLFRKLFHSGQAFGACRWLKSFQRQCEYMAVLGCCDHVPSSSSTSSSSSGAAVISPLGKKGVLELAQRMTASFYAAISGPVTIASTTNINQWFVCTSNGIDPGERVDAPVRMVIWNCAEIVPGQPVITVLSATTTIRLPGVPPVHVFEYLCNLQRRGEWDTNLVNGGAVKELGYVSTSARLHGNAVSVLRPTIVAQGNHGTNSNMLILQQSRTDASGSLVVYSLIEENVMRGIMAGGAENNIFLVPSGFAIFPDGHGKARYNAAPSSSSSSDPIVNDDNDGEGALLTVTFQAMLPSSPSGDDHATARAFDNAGQQLCDAIKKIKEAVGAKNVVVN